MTSETTRYGFRAVHPDFRSRNGYVWPFPGQTAHASGPFDACNKSGCPNYDGDGICLATTAQGAASGSIPLITVLVCSYDTADVLGSEQNGSKIRVTKAEVLSVHDFPATLRSGSGAGASDHLPRVADLRGANLRYANLRSADLYGANLRSADLYGANLRGADLCGANLRYADLSGADLYGANLRYANLRGADLRGADLRRADLSGAAVNIYTRLPVSHVLRDGWVVAA